jgi:uracil-DNA glycosylase
MVRPKVIVLVGGLAHERFLPGQPLSELVGGVFDGSGKRVSLRTRTRPVLVPLPHPSGASRWLNDPSNRALVDRALDNLRVLVRPYLPKVDGHLARA